MIAQGGADFKDSVSLRSIRSFATQVRVLLRDNESRAVKNRDESNGYCETLLLVLAAITTVMQFGRFNSSLDDVFCNFSHARCIGYLSLSPR